MAIIYLSVGSNIDPVRHIQAGMQTLQAHYGHLVLSSVYESEAIGFSGANFYNLAVVFHTQEAPDTVVENLRQIEALHGRKRGSLRSDARTLDLDLILYDDLILETKLVKLPRADILKYAFVLAPLAEIAPDMKHPVLQQTYRELWQNFDQKAQPVWIVPIDVSPRISVLS